MDRPEDLLRAYEDEVLVPLVEAAGLSAVRHQNDVVMPVGAIVPFINQAASFQYRDDLIWWTPIEVFYTDRRKNSDVVFSMQASFDPQLEVVSFEVVELRDIVQIVRRQNKAVWVEPVSGNQFIEFETERADKVLMNGWYLFVGGVLPLLREERYHFARTTPERVCFQAGMIENIVSVYGDLP